MKVQNLQIGDWVFKPSLCDIESLKIGQLELDDFSNEEEYGVLSACRPIPLTPEILEKNGFEPIENKVVDEAYIFDRNEFEEPDIIIRRFDFNDSFVLCTVMDNTAIISIAYVHELQHALRLCGIEKEINL